MLMNENENNFLPPEWLLDDLPVVAFETGDSGELSYINRGIRPLTGYDPSELLNGGLEKLLPELHRSILGLSSCTADGEDCSEDIQVTTKNGHRYLRVIARQRCDENKECMRGIVLDISDVVLLQQELNRSRERFNRLSDTAMEGIVFIDATGVLDANKAMEDLTGISVDALVGRSPGDIFNDEIVENINGLTEEIGRSLKGETVIQGSDGVEREVEVSGRSFLCEGRPVVSMSVHDISSSRRLEYLQSHDELTDLLNEQGVMPVLRDMMETAMLRKSSLMVMTIRYTRDTATVIRGMSHDLERVMLKTLPMAIADRFKRDFFRTDVLARTGEQEFLSLHTVQRGESLQNIIRVVQKALGIFEEEYMNGIRLKPHIGVTFYPDDYAGTSPSRVLENSRYACEEADHIGERYSLFDHSTYMATKERIEFVRDMIVAIREEECRSCEVYYQPKVNPEGRIVGAEALIRWNNRRWGGDDGMVSPGRFIPVAEEIGLVEDIDFWMLRQAAEDIARWNREITLPHGFQVAVNVSPSHLDAGYLATLDRILKETEIDPPQLELEITERESMRPENEEIIRSIRSRGVCIAVDDFGIDYSSLSRLPKLDVNTIKLDRSYVMNIINDIDYENLVRYTIEMVHSFSYSVVAEGVEDEAQAHKLFNEMNCDKIQGYYYYRPMELADFETVLQQWKD